MIAFAHAFLTISATVTAGAVSLAGSDSCLGKPGACQLDVATLADAETEEMRASLLQRRVQPSKMEAGGSQAAPPTADAAGNESEPPAPGCATSSKSACVGGEAWLAVGEACEPLCPAGQRPLGAFVCRTSEQPPEGPGCQGDIAAEPSDVDAVADAQTLEDMVFPKFRLQDASTCLIWPELPEAVQQFIVAQAGKYGPSATAINAAKKLGTEEKTEFFLSIEQVSILVAQLLCGATEVASGDALPEGSGTNPQPFAFGRAMEHWYYKSGANASSTDAVVREELWRRTTLVGYGTFDSDGPVPNGTSTVSTGSSLKISSGCGLGGASDSGIGDSRTITTVFAGHYVGGWMGGWYHDNRYGAQEEKIGTIVPEMMLATETLRKMGAGLLSRGVEDPWLPKAGWYIIGAGSYVKGAGYPRWSSEKIQLSDDDDYFHVGSGRRIRRHGLVAIMAKPCNDRGSCGENSYDEQYRCYNRQVEDRDLDAAPHGNLWGAAGGAFNFANWPAKTGALMLAEQVEKTWMLQAGGWGAGAFGCGTLYGGLVQALAAKKGGWQQLRMCWAGRGDPRPSLDKKIGYAVAGAVAARSVTVAPLRGTDVNNFTEGFASFHDDAFGAVASMLRHKIDEHLPERTCATVNCDRWNNKNGNCKSNMEWCFQHQECGWHTAKTQDLRDFMASNCNPDCGSSAGICSEDDVPKPTPAPTPAPTPPPTSPPTATDIDEDVSPEAMTEQVAGVAAS